MMNYPTTIHTPAPAKPQRWLQALLAVSAGFILFAGLLVTSLLAYDIYYMGKIYPGVSIAGTGLSGLSPDQAASKIATQIKFPTEGRVVFQHADQLWVARPVEVGLYLDAQSSALAAFAVGRQGPIFGRIGTQFSAWHQGRGLSPVLVYDQRAALAYLEQIAAELYRPTVEAELSINGTDVVVVAGQIGRNVNLAATLAPLENQLRSLSDSLVPIVMEETAPVILDASEQAAIARQILSAPLRLEVPQASDQDPGPWIFEPQELAAMLTISRVDTPTGARYQVGLEASRLRGFLQEIAPQFQRTPENARFIFNDDTRLLEVIQPAVIGRQLNIEATLEQINTALYQGAHQIELVFDYTNPEVGDDATGASLGITELVHAETSYFYGSSGSRIQNIQTAAARFHGVLVPPGASFSMAEVLGDVSLDNGYAEALIIYGNRTIKGVGGGVCQVSTTLFRTVFFAGYPVVERHPHAYRVSYYELNAAGNVNAKLAGLDATVFVPVVDFKFTNDTPYWLLMETYVNAAARTLTWKFYSTSEGRTVEWDTTGLMNVEEPPEPLYQENPDLAKGEIKQVDWEAAGADVTVERTVYRAGQVYLQDSYSTHYMPWRAVYEYGPGTKLPNDQKNRRD